MRYVEDEQIRGGGGAAVDWRVVFVGERGMGAMWKKRKIRGEGVGERTGR